MCRSKFAWFVAMIVILSFDSTLWAQANSLRNGAKSSTGQRQTTGQKQESTNPQSAGNSGKKDLNNNPATVPGAKPQSAPMASKSDSTPPIAAGNSNSSRNSRIQPSTGGNQATTRLGPPKSGTIPNASSPAVPQKRTIPGANPTTREAVANAPGSGTAPPQTPGVVAPTPGGQTTGAAPAPRVAEKPQKTVVEVYGEEIFKEMGLPDDARHLTVEQAMALGTKIAVTDHLRIPRAATGKMTTTEISDVAALLQKFGADDEIQSEEFWKHHVEHGFDSAIGPHTRDNLGLPEGVHRNSPSSKIMEDAGEIQTYGLDITKQESWDLYSDFQAGNKSRQNLIDVANSRGKPGKGSGGRGSNGGNPGNGNSSNGNNGSTTGHPGNGSSELPGKGSGGQQGNSDSSTNPPGSQSQNRGNPGVGNNSNLDGDSFEAVDTESFTAVVTHNDDSSFTVDIYRNDGAGNSTKVTTSTYSDADGDGTFRDDKGSTSDGKPPEGTMEAEKDEEKEEYTWTWSEESDSSSSDDSSTDTDTDAGDAGDTGTETNPDDKYTPGPEGELYYSYEWMVTMYQQLSADKHNAGKGGKDSTPNPMNETYGGRYPLNYKDMIERPVDGNSGSTANVPVEALKQSLNPLDVQGGIIDPVKNKDQ